MKKTDNAQKNKILKEKERAKKLRLRERAKKQKQRERAKVKKLRERAKKLKLREKAKKLRERERAKKLKLREKAKLEREKNKALKREAKQTKKLEKTEKPAKEPKVREPRNKAKGEANRILRESKKRLRMYLKTMKSSPLFKGPKVFLNVLEGNPYNAENEWSARLENGKIKLDFTVSYELPVSEKFLNNVASQPKGVVPPDQPKDSLDKAIEETCPISSEIAAMLANPPAEMEDSPSPEIVPAGDLYGTDGAVDEAETNDILDADEEESSTEDEIEDHPDVPDYRDEQDEELVENRREFYENFSEDLEPLDD